MSIESWTESARQTITERGIHYINKVTFAAKLNAKPANGRVSSHRVCIVHRNANTPFTPVEVRVVMERFLLIINQFPADKLVSIYISDPIIGHDSAAFPFYIFDY